jgi:hypothetical protein
MQSPSIFHWDTFFHSATAVRIEVDGHISPSIGYMSYPGTGIFSAIFANVLGLPSLETSEALASFWILLIILILSCFGRLFAKTKVELAEGRWLIPTIFLAFNFVLYNNYHYSPQLLGLCLYILFVYVCVKKVSLKAHAQALNIILIFLVSMLTITHVFSALISVVTLLCIYIGENKIKVLGLSSKLYVTLMLFMFGTVVFISWHIFIATWPLEWATSSLLALIKGERTLIGIETFLYSPRAKWMLTPFLNIYRYGIYLLFGSLGAIGLLFSRRREEGKLLFLLGVGVLFGELTIYLTPATFGVSRLVHYGAVIVSILSSFAIIKKGYGTHILVVNRVVSVFKVILPFLVIGTFLVTNLYGSNYVKFVHPDEITAIQFVAQKNTRKISAVIEYAFLAPFFTREPLPMVTIKKHDSSDIAKKAFEDEESSLQYLPRQQYYYNLSFIEGNNNLIYSNGLTRIYSKTTKGV